MVDPSPPPSLWDAFRTGLKDLQILWKTPSGDSFGRELVQLSKNRTLLEVRHRGRTPSRAMCRSRKNIPASDVAAVNAQQTARNEAFFGWVAGICAQLQELGFSPETNFDQAPENWYVQPVMAHVRILGPESESSCRLAVFSHTGSGKKPPLMA